MIFFKFPRQTPNKLMTDTKIFSHRASFVSALDSFVEKKLQALQGEKDTNADEHKHFMSLARIRPMFEHEETNNFVCVKAINSTKLALATPSFHFTGKAQPKYASFTLDGVYGPEANSEQIYVEHCQSLVELVAQGGISTLLLYGQTGSGKTFTAMSLAKSASTSLFDALLGKSVVVHFLAVEFLGQQAFDLFSGEEVSVLEDQHREVQVHGAGLRQHTVESAAHLQALFDEAFQSRSSASTQRNDTSSRSHAVFRISVQFTDERSVAAAAEPGILHLVDLAGSERASDRSEHTRDRMDEAKHINTSLMTLQACIVQRANVGTKVGAHHIPFRQSRVTLLLKSAFDVVSVRPTRLTTIVCVSPLSCDTRHSLSTLKYGASVRVSSSVQILQKDEDDPQNWNRDRTLQFVKTITSSTFNDRVLLPLNEHGGRYLTSLSQPQVEQLAVEAGMSRTAGKRLFEQISTQVFASRMKMRATAKKALKSGKQ